MFLFQVRFNFHMYGPHSGALALFLLDVQSKQRMHEARWYAYGDRGDKWLRGTYNLSLNIEKPYVLIHSPITRYWCVFLLSINRDFHLFHDFLRFSTYSTEICFFFAGTPCSLRREEATRPKATQP